MTLSELIARRGIDERRAVRNLRRRDRYALHCDRPKTFADCRTTDLYAGYWPRGLDYKPADAERDLLTIKTTDATQAYVQAWCRLNHLTTGD